VGLCCEDGPSNGFISKLSLALREKDMVESL
jgi:hypothetical protein